jgi:hypothetical protein
MPREPITSQEKNVEVAAHRWKIVMERKFSNSEWALSDSDIAVINHIDRCVELDSMRGTESRSCRFTPIPQPGAQE